MSTSLKNTLKADEASYGGRSLDARRAVNSIGISPGPTPLNHAESEANDPRYFMGHDKNSFPMIRDEKEEAFAPKDSSNAFKTSITKNYPAHEDTFERRTRAEGASPFKKAAKYSWTNPEHMEKLEEFLQQDNQSRTMLIENLNKNMENIQTQLQSPHNFRKFFWTPDFNVYGFASRGEMSQRMEKWKVEDAKLRGKGGPKKKPVDNSYTDHFNAAGTMGDQVHFDSLPAGYQRGPAKDPMPYSKP